MDEAQAQNLEGRIAKAEEILKGVRDEISKAKEQPVKRWEPDSGERYLTCDGDGELRLTENTGKYDKHRIAMGNCSPPHSKDKLSHHVRRIKLMNELFQVALAIDGEKAGVFEVSQENWSVNYNHHDKRNNSGVAKDTCYGDVYFSTHDKCRQAWDMISQESRDFLMGK